MEAIEILEQGSCSTRITPFKQPEQAAVAASVCEGCPVLDECAAAIGPVALEAMRTHRAPEHARVIAGRLIEWEVVTEPGSYPHAAELDGDPERSLAVIRQAMRSNDERLHFGRVTDAQARRMERLSRIYEAESGTSMAESLGYKDYMLAWRYLINGIGSAGTAGRRMLTERAADVAALAAVYLRDVQTISDSGFRQAPGLAIYHAPDDLQQVIRSYTDRPDCSPWYIRRIMTFCTRQPRDGVESYLARVRFFRTHFRGLADAPQSIIRQACASCTDLSKCHAQISRGLGRWNEVRDSRLAERYPEWLLAEVAGWPVGKQDKRLASWDALVRETAAIPQSLDNPSDLTGNDRHGTMHEPAAEQQRQDQDLIIECLSALPPMEQDAVARVYGLDWLLDKESPSRSELERHFRTASLEEFVHEEIIPKLASL